jgi:hypothetical protein
MAKTPPIQDIQSGFSSTITLNSNFTALKDAFDNTLSLDGSTPNAMQAELDLANNNVINVNTLEADALLLNGVPITPSNAAGAAFQNITVFGSNLIDDENASEARTTLGLATVAATGSYTDLINTPTLGTAAATNSTAYATAAQGSLADTALQLTDTLLTSDWQAGTSTSEAIVSPAKVKAAIDALSLKETGRDVTGDAGYLTLSNGFIIQWDNWNYSHGYRNFPITYPNACLGFSYNQSSGWYENWNGYKVSNSQYYTSNVYAGLNASRATGQAMFSIGY